MRYAAVTLILALVAALVVHDVHAASARRDEGGEADARLQMMVQQLNSEKVTLERRNRELDEELAKIKGALEALEREKTAVTGDLRGVQGSLAARTVEKDALAAQNEELRSRLNEIVERYRTLAETLQAAQVEQRTLVGLTQDYEERVAMCEEHNRGLHTIAGELIDLYQRKGAFAVLRERDPIVGVTRARVENMLGEYQELADTMARQYQHGATDEKTIDQ